MFLLTSPFRPNREPSRCAKTWVLISHFFFVYFVIAVGFFVICHVSVCAWNLPRGFKNESDWPSFWARTRIEKLAQIAALLDCTPYLTSGMSDTSRHPASIDEVTISPFHV